MVTLLLAHCSKCEMYMFLFYVQGRVSEGFDLKDSGNLLLERTGRKEGMAVTFPEGFALTLFVLSRLILDHRGLLPLLPPLAELGCLQLCAVCSCVSTPFCVLWVPRPVQDLGSTLGPCPHSVQKPPSDTDHQTLHPICMLSQQPALPGSLHYHNYSVVNGSLNVYLPH